MTRNARATLLALAAWAGLIALAWAWGNHLNDTLPNDMLVQAPPLTAHFGWSVPPTILAAVAFGALGVAFGPRLASSLGWTTLLVVATLATLAWTLALVLGDGTHHVLSSVTSRIDYLAGVHFVASPGSFLAHFTEEIARYPTHVESHPPGLVLTLWAMGQIGLGSAEAAAALFVIGGALAVPAVMLAVREVTTEPLARSVGPFLVFAPMAVWVGTSADALFAGVAAWACALLILASGREGRRRDALALLGGLCFAATLYLSYGLALLALVPLAVIVHRRAWRVLWLAAIPVAVAFLAFGAAGFWWFDGLLATRERYLVSVARFRPYGYFLLANLAAFAIVIGPATAAGFARLRDGRLWLLVGAALAGIALADISGMSKAEVERIWLPFASWVMTACVPLARSPRARLWLALQAGFAILLQVGIRSPW